MASAAERAVQRLDQALRQLEEAVEEKVGGLTQGVATEIQTLNADRARLAESLDRSESRVRRLDNVNRDVSRRLVMAMETIRAALASDGKG
ncbi:protein of unknown function [Faunimonas pinastri]|uniref:DUF4164 family protein n=1 Tax=Faunimonas pinastri TaxID=1855383 RepID=A0A1H8Z4F5_9HYPH|nr:DUF4164 family protein [Faunimonas pinastri]SEP59300.1 protein of unknown function [Faunimonas pinastri]